MKGTGRTNLYEELAWETLKSRRARRKLVIFHSMVYSYCPRHLQLLLPQTVGSYSHYPLRNAANIILPHCRTSQYYNSFIPTMVRTWNDLSMEMKETEDKRAFVSFYVHLFHVKTIFIHLVPDMSQNAILRCELALVL